MSLVRLKSILAAVLLTLLVGCQPEPTPVPSPLDFTQPGVAGQMIERLIEKAGSDELLMVAIHQQEITISVVADKAPLTWAYRNQELSEVSSDLTDVNQATFSVDDFNISDVGGLFRAAAGVSGSAENQVLQIVDYSGGRVMMSVSTNPESHTVFFNPSGSLLQELDFTTKGGISTGFDEVTESVSLIYTLGIDSVQGAWVDYRSGSTGTVVRSQRTAAVPVTTTDLAATSPLETFNPTLIDPKIIWDTLHAELGTAEIPVDSHWSVLVEVPSNKKQPAMTFTIGSKTLVTDLKGNQIN